MFLNFYVYCWKYLQSMFVSSQNPRTVERHLCHGLWCSIKNPGNCVANLVISAVSISRFYQVCFKWLNCIVFTGLKIWSHNLSRVQERRPPLFWPCWAEPTLRKTTPMLFACLRLLNWQFRLEKSQWKWLNFVPTSKFVSLFEEKNVNIQSLRSQVYAKCNVL